MKKKLVVMFMAAIIIFGLGNQLTTHADNQIPKMTSIKPISFVALEN